MVSQPVLAVRVPYEENDTIKKFLTEAFSYDEEINIGYLTQYTFFTSQPLGDITRTHIQALVYKKNLFQKHIQYFIVHGLHNIESPHKFPTSETLPQTQDNSTVAQHPDANTDTEMEDPPKPSSQCSLRYYLYQVVEPGN